MSSNHNALELANTGYEFQSGVVIHQIESFVDSILFPTKHFLKRNKDEKYMFMQKLLHSLRGLDFKVNVNNSNSKSKFEMIGKINISSKRKTLDKVWTNLSLYMIEYRGIL
eukprot:snap_masked-scaffold_17-processed-gene-1.29-mRNA-1 protein AED:1.00 eAED:1.00 QI:0/-1/0/0/-1/1/1/0/110